MSNAADLKTILHAFADRVVGASDLKDAIDELELDWLDGPPATGAPVQASGDAVDAAGAAREARRAQLRQELAELEGEGAPAG